MTIPGVPPPPPVASPPPPPRPEPPPAPPPRRRAPIIVAALIGFLVVLICAGYFVYAGWPRPAIRPQAQPVPTQQAEAVPPEATPTPLAVTPAPTQEAATTPAPRPHKQSPMPPAVAASARPTAAAPPLAPQDQEQQAPPPPQQSASVESQPVAPAPVQPMPVQPVVPMRRAYEGPLSGWLIWTGKLAKNDTLTIDGATASTGAVKGELPGVPVNIIVDVTNIGLDEEPGPRNGWKRMVLRSLGKHSIIRVHWMVKQGG